MLTISPAAPIVNHGLLTFPTEAESNLADRLAWEADGGDPDDYRPGWVADQVAPLIEDEFFETGRSIGLEGCLVFVEETSIGHLASADSPEREAFALGLRAGRTEHARSSGHAWGLDGKPLADGAVHECRWWNDAFALGHAAGLVERAEREREMAAYFQRLDWEREYEAEMREVEAINREVGGWERAGNLALI